MEQKHAACVERCLYDIYTEIPCLGMSGSNDMAVLNQVCFQTLFIVRHVNPIPNSRKGMVVQQDFEKGKSQRLWFRRYDRYKKLAGFFSGSHVGGGGGGGGLVLGTLRYVCKDLVRSNFYATWHGTVQKAFGVH